MRGTRLRVLRGLLLALPALVVLAPAARAQTVTANPTAVSFTPSADHTAVLSDGRPLVDHYDLDVYSVGASQPFQSSNLGKPDPGADGLIYYDFSTGIAAWPLPGGNYEARVAAVGPSGRSTSDPSNLFTFETCVYALSGSSALLPATGGGTQVGLTTGTGCAWTASSNATWVALSPTNGTGSATVVASVAANTSTTARSATLTVGGQPFTINEQGAAVSTPLPSAPASPTPADLATGVSTSPTLSWIGAGAASYTVRFGTNNPPPQVAAGRTTTTYVPGTLAIGTTYYWQVIAVNGAGSTEGPIWTFRTSPRRGKKK